MFFLPLGLEIVPGRLIIKHPPKKNFSEKKNICKKKRIGQIFFYLRLDLKSVPGKATSHYLLQKQSLFIKGVPGISKSNWELVKTQKNSLANPSFYFTGFLMDFAQILSTYFFRTVLEDYESNVKILNIYKFYLKSFNQKIFQQPIIQFPNYFFISFDSSKDSVLAKLE